MCALAGCASTSAPRETIRAIEPQRAERIEEGFWSRIEGEPSFMHVRENTIAFMPSRTAPNTFSIPNRGPTRARFTLEEGRIRMLSPEAVAIGTFSNAELHLDWLPHVLGHEGTYRHVEQSEVPSSFQVLTQPQREMTIDLRTEAAAMQEEMRRIQEQADAAP